jgi:hypothetical protein
MEVHWEDDEKSISEAKSTGHPNVDGRSIAVAVRSRFMALESLTLQ